MLMFSWCVTCYVLFDVRCSFSLVVLCCLWLVVCGLLFVDACSWFVVCGVLFVYCGLLCVVCYSVFVVGYMLLLVRC